jgi:cellulose synthase/poly-beta-1,6-N-acetylglucosamine synthase-like glycosyltransferase
VILSYTFFFNKLSLFAKDNTVKHETRFSIVIPARNEAENIEQCVCSIINNNYPTEFFEIIVADDFSTDETPHIVRKLQQQFNNIQLLQLKDHISSKQNSYKKKSIELAVSFAANEWIITTDADCIVKPHWLETLDAYIQKTKPVFIAAPVKFKNNGSFISIFQCLDFISLQGITAASVGAGLLSMCNGANLAYKKDAFYAVDGFKGVDDIASGDDMLLMHKIKKQFPNKIAYLFSKDAIVSTLPMPDWKSFINQRIRWASKATNYDDKRIFFVLLLVYIFNLLLLLLLFLSFFYTPFFFFWLILLLSKIFFETAFMLPVAAFYNQKKLMWWFPLMQPFHIFYTVVSGWLGKFGSYEWKGRNVK